MTPDRRGESVTANGPGRVSQRRGEDGHTIERRRMGNGQRPKAVQRERRSEVRNRRKRLLIRTIVISVSIVFLVLFLQLVALPLLDSGAHLFGR